MRAQTDSDADGVTDDIELEYDDTDNDGIANYLDPDDDNDTRPTLVEGGTSSDADGDETPDYLEIDEDDDSLVGLAEDVTHDALLTSADDSDSDGVIDSLDADDDGDGVPTRTELGEGGAGSPRDTDGDTRPDYLDADDDDDGVPTLTERRFGDVDQNHNGVLAYRDRAEQGRSEADSDGDGTPDSGDTDDDDDGVADTAERQGDSDSDGRVDRIDADDDGDHVPTRAEYVSEAQAIDTDQDGIVDYLDVDDDGDGIPTIDEDPDPNGDGALDDARSTSGARDYLEPDDDRDGVPTLAERTAGVDRDTDQDGIPDQRDSDDDGDGRDTSFELGHDSDSDGVLDYLDVDDDGDGLLTSVECGEFLTLDYDLDGLLNCLDLDSDGDSISDAEEGLLDRNGNGRPDYLDAINDADNDGVKDALECATGLVVCPDTDQDGVPDRADPDDDGDGVPTRLELGPDTQPRDTDRDGIADYLDPDDDGDGKPTLEEGGPERDSDGDYVPDYLDAVASPLPPDAGYATADAGAADADAGVPLTDAGSDGVLGTTPRATHDGCSVGDGSRRAPASALWWGVFCAAIMLRSRRLGRAGALAAMLGACGDDDVQARVELSLDGSVDGEIGLDAQAQLDAGDRGCSDDELVFHDLPPTERRGFGAALLGNRVHVGFLLRGCGESLGQGAPATVRYLSFATSGGASDPRDLSRDDCAPLDEPTLVAQGGDQISILVGHTSQDSFELDSWTSNGGGTPVTEISSPYERWLALAAAPLVSRGPPTLAFRREPLNATDLPLAAVGGFSPGKTSQEVLPAAARHDPVNVAIGAVTGAALPGVVAWVSNLGASTGVFARSVDADGRGASEVATLTSNVGPHSAVAIATRSDVTALVYTESRDAKTHELRYRALKGDVLGTQVKLSSASKDIVQLAAVPFRTGFAIAYRNLGNELNPQPAIELVVIDAQGISGGIRHLADTSASGTQVALLAGDDGRLVVLWDQPSSADAGPSGALDLHVARLTCP